MKLTELFAPLLGKTFESTDTYYTKAIWNELKSNYKFERVSKGLFTIEPKHSESKKINKFFLALYKYGNVYSCSMCTNSSKLFDPEQSFIIVQKENTIELIKHDKEGASLFSIRNKRLTCNQRSFVKALFKAFGTPTPAEGRIKLKVQFEYLNDKIILLPNTLTH